MTDNDKILTVVHEWTAKAENDLKNAVHTLKMGRDCPTSLRAGWAVRGKGGGETCPACATQDA